MSNKQIEIEFRSVFDEEEYNRLMDFLQKNAEDLGEDDKDTNYFLLPEKVVKTVNNISKGTAKIVMKMNRVGTGTSDFEEVEIFIKPEDFDNATRLFKNLDFEQVQNSYQKRHNYNYKGIELAVKYTESWGYHAELEIVVSDSNKQSEAEAQIRAIAEELGIKLLSEEELKEIAKKIDAKYAKKS